MRHGPIQRQYGECDENADACQDVSERLVRPVPVCDESRAKNDGGRHCNQEEASNRRQSLPSRKHTLPSPDVSHGAEHDRDNADQYEAPPLQPLHVHADGRKERRKNDRGNNQRPPMRRLFHKEILLFARQMAEPLTGTLEFRHEKAIRLHCVCCDHTFFNWRETECAEPRYGH